jgi:hypothetical protein
MSDIEKQKVEFDNFVDMWDKALEKGIFKAGELPNVNPQTSQSSFFGFTNTNPSEEINKTDNDYWNAIYATSSDHAETNMLNEQDHRNVYPSNPQSRDSLGTDQDMEPQQLGVTYSNEELEKIEGLKKELYELEVKYNTSMGFGDTNSQKKLSAQIESKKQEINKLSDDTGIAYKNDTPKHLQNY